MNKRDLETFEKEIAESFNKAQIRAPIHLHGNNEDQLIEIFKSIKSNDWIFSSWRSHYHCLLKGVPPERLKKDILDGKSITLIYPEYKIYTSAIVGGIIPPKDEKKLLSFGVKAVFTPKDFRIEEIMKQIAIIIKKTYD